MNTQSKSAFSGTKETFNKMMNDKANHGLTFEIKNLKYAEFASEETNCFEATLYMNGKRLCVVSNEGRGGCDNYRPLNGEAYNQLSRRIQEINEKLSWEQVSLSEGSDETISNNLEIVVAELVTNTLLEREIKKHLKRVCYVKPETPKGNFFKLPAKHKPGEEIFRAIKQAKWWKKDYIILNELTLEEAKKYF